MEITVPRLDGRLAACAKWVRRGSILADVGTDHAYLPTALATGGWIRSAVASDIGSGPCENARQTVEAAGLGDMITVIQADGLSGTEKYGPDDIVIAGMGGETIIDILSAAKWLTPDMRLILQPMTRQAELWRYLADEGYTLTASDLASANAPRSSGKNNDKIYEIVVCSPGGRRWSLSDSEAFLRLRGCAAPAGLQRLHAEKTLRYLREMIDGIKSGGDPDLEKARRLENIEREITAALADMLADI